MRFACEVFYGLYSQKRKVGREVASMEVVLVLRGGWLCCKVVVRCGPVLVAVWLWDLADTPVL